MIQSLRATFFAACSFILVVPSVSFAKPTDSSTYTQCAELVKECFSNNGSERLSCFYSTAKHPFCEGSELGKLTFMRWSMGPSQGGTEDAPGLFGPQLVDEKCLLNFDNEWSASLIKGGPISPDSIKSLSNSLGHCKKDISNEILRP